MAYAARQQFPLPQPIYLLGEIIHNPEVNDQIQKMGIQIMKMDNRNNIGQLFQTIALTRN